MIQEFDNLKAKDAEKKRKMIGLHQVSFCSFKIIPSFKDLNNKLHKLAEATGFLYRKNKIIYLITNRHVVTGKDNLTNKYLANLAVSPSEILIFNIWQYSDDTKKSINNRSNLEIQLYDNNKNPSWFIHPIYKKSIDVVACPLWEFEDVDKDKEENELFNTLKCINDSETQDDIRFGISEEVFVVGYPFGKTGSECNHTPIWKRATIASEPDLNFYADGRPSFLIDTTTRPGMSGSPVIKLTDKNEYMLVGVYSGRSKFLRPEDNSFIKIEDKAQIHKIIEEYEATSPYLGIVWRQDVIDEIIDGQIKDDLND